jgi:hypothetical protein
MTMASSTTGLHALRFLTIWVVMMVAMMLPKRPKVNCGAISGHVYGLALSKLKG